MIPYLLFALRILLAIVFILAGASKVRRPILFSRQVAAYRLLPRFLVRPIAFLLPWVELIVGFALLIGIKTMYFAFLSAILMFIFSLAVGINLALGRKDIDCGCYSYKHAETISIKLIYRDLLFLLSSLTLIRFGGGFLVWDNLPETFKNFLLLEIGLQHVLPLYLIFVGSYLLYCLVRQLGCVAILWIWE